MSVAQDGGSSDASAVDAGGGLHGIHSFDVVATIDHHNAPQVTVQTSPTVTVVVPIPTNQTFTMLLDFDAGVAIINSDEFQLTTTDGRTFTVHGTFPTYIGNSPASVFYGDTEITFTGDTLAGFAAGSVIPQTGFEIATSP